jgi:hypothetical protein
VQLELTDEKAAALLALLNRTIENDRYPLSPRIRVMRGIRGSCRARRPNRRRSDRREPAGHAVHNSAFFGPSVRLIVTAIAAASPPATPSRASIERAR